MENCIFCSIIKNNDPHHEIIWSDENHIALLDVNPVKEGHVLVIPKKHTEHIFDMPEDDYLDLLKASRTVAAKIQKIYESKRIAMFVTGTSVPHTHVHLLPINNEGELGTFHHTKLEGTDFKRIADKFREQE